MFSVPPPTGEEWKIVAALVGLLVAVLALSVVLMILFP